ncbi:MAG: sulfurtransferase TusA family protein [Archaeoglobaceae archaeon]
MAGNAKLHKLDLSGEICPFTFIETKLKLEELEEGEILELIIDDPTAVRNLPKSVISEGHEVIEIKKCDTKWLIAIRKRKT